MGGRYCTPGRGFRHYYRGKRVKGSIVVVHIKDETTGEMIVPRMSDYIVSSDECMEGLSDVGIKHYLGTVGKSILGDDPQLQTSMRNLLQSMMVDKSVNNIVNIATVKRQRCDRLNMPYLLGQMRGIEISESASTKDIDPKDTLDGVESNHNVECPISQAQTM